MSDAVLVLGATSAIARAAASAFAEKGHSLYLAGRRIGGSMESWVSAISGVREASWNSSSLPSWLKKPFATTR